MIIPEGFSEEEVLEIIDKVARRMLKKFRVGYFEYDDVFQEGRACAIEALRRYEPGGFVDGRAVRPLENFLTRHLRNRLNNNILRDRLKISKSPCPRCRVGDECEEGGCEAHKKWVKVNAAKGAIVNPMGLLETDKLSEGQAEIIAENNELRAILDRAIPSRLRGDYLRMLAGIAIEEERAEEIREIVREVLRGEEGAIEGI